MSQTFGRKAPATARWTPQPAPRTRVAAPRAASVDPEFQAWSQARAATRWRTWGLGALLVLSGPLSFLLPSPFGALAGWGLVAAGGIGLLLRRLTPKADADQA